MYDNAMSGNQSEAVMQDIEDGRRKSPYTDLLPGSGTGG